MNSSPLPGGLSRIEESVKGGANCCTRRASCVTRDEPHRGSRLGACDGGDCRCHAAWGGQQRQRHPRRQPWLRGILRAAAHKAFNIMSKIFILSLGLASCFAAHAGDLSASADVVRSRVAGIRYENGGIGREEVHDLARTRGAYSLHLSFSEGRRNAFVTGVGLRVVDASGKPVFHLTSAGPLTDLALPPGHYQVMARLGATDRSTSVDVRPGHGTTAALHWPADKA